MWNNHGRRKFTMWNSRDGRVFITFRRGMVGFFRPGQVIYKNSFVQAESCRKFFIYPVQVHGKKSRFDLIWSQWEIHLCYGIYIGKRTFLLNFQWGSKLNAYNKASQNFNHICELFTFSVSNNHNHDILIGDSWTAEAHDKLIFQNKSQAPGWKCMSQRHKPV